MGLIPYGKAQFCPECNGFGECEQTLYSHEPGEPSTEEWSCDDVECPVNGWTIVIPDVHVNMGLTTPKPVK